MKKILIIIFSFCLSLVSFSLAVYDAANHRSNMITQIESVKQTIEQVQHTKNQIEQLKNQFQQLENEARNLKQIGKDLSSGNLNSIKAGLDKILTFEAQTRSQFFKAEDFMNQFDSLYRTDEQLSDPYKVSLEYGIKENKRALQNVRKETSKVIFDSMRQAGYNPTINDKRNIEMLISKANTTEGALQAIQAGNNILGQMATTLIEIRNVLGKSVVVASAVSEETRMTTQIVEEKTKQEMTKYEDENKTLQEKAKKLKGTIDNQKTNIKWRGI